MTFQLDTSGRVVTDVSEAFETYHEWSDLTPFTQGYIEALFDEYGPKFTQGDGYDGLYWVPCFSDLAAETLARIIADCVERAWPETDGRWFWVSRQNGNLDGFPPLTVTIGDDGKVRFA